MLIQKKVQRFYLRFGLLLLAMVALPANAQDCDADYVDFSSEGEVKITPSSMDDSENIQCAVDEAINLGKTKISLERGEFLLGASIALIGFTGEFSGVSKASTTVRTTPNSWECAAGDRDKDRQLFRVGNGSVKFSTMSVIVDDPCIPSANSARWTAIDIAPIRPLCDKRVSFSSVDRVDLTLNTAEDDGYYTAISAGGSSHCPDSLLGTLKVNRSTIKGWTDALQTSMVGGAQVDVNYCDFVSNIYAIKIENANQLTSIQRNSFYLNSPDHVSSRRPHGIGFFGSGEDAPKQNVLSIANNKFYDEVDVGHELRLDYGYTTKSQAISVSIVGNRFEEGAQDLGQDGIGSISVTNIDAGFIAKNTFLENTFAHIYFFGREGRGPADGWAIVGNSFPVGDAGIQLEELTRSNIVGPEQSVRVNDYGMNFILN